MFSSLKLTLAALAMGVGFIAAGCESMDKDDAKSSSSATSVASRKAVACEKCKVTWVNAPVKNDKGRVIAYTTKASHECPDCRAAVQNFFTTGNLKHECASCGADALQKCEAHM
jgi:hypothetical protein